MKRDPRRNVFLVFDSYRAFRNSRLFQMLVNAGRARYTLTSVYCLACKARLPIGNRFMVASACNAFAPQISTGISLHSRHACSSSNRPHLVLQLFNHLQDQQKTIQETNMADASATRHARLRRLRVRQNMFLSCFYLRQADRFGQVRIRVSLRAPNTWTRQHHSCFILIFTFSRNRLSFQEIRNLTTDAQVLHHIQYTEIPPFVCSSKCLNG